MTAEKTVYLIEKIIPGGYGLTRDENGVVLVPFAAPGDRVTLENIGKYRGTRRGDIGRIVEASPIRVEPPCPLYGDCGGCDLQHISYEGQLQVKTDILIDSLLRQGGFDAGDPLLEQLSFQPARPLQGRNRFQFHEIDGRLGLKRRESGEVLPLKTCPVADPLINGLLADPGPALADAPAGATGSGSGGTHRPDRASRPGGSDTVPDGGLRVPVYSNGRELVFGQGEIGVEIGGATLRFDVRGFFQSSISGVTGLIDWFRGEIRGSGLSGGRALDLYCGVGLFGAMLPPEFSEVEAVEINRHSLEYAKRNIGERGRYYAMPVDKWVKKRFGKTGAPARDEAPELIIVDPPRSGLDAPLRELLMKLKSPVIAYISCDPVTFARDLAVLKKHYQVKSLRGFDLSPQNHHVEAGAILVLRDA